jgi:hypothetical protein
MRKLIVTGVISLDGFFEGVGQNVWAMPMDGFFDAHNLERMRAADTLLGQGTYLAFKGAPDDGSHCARGRRPGLHRPDRVPAPVRCAAPRRLGERGAAVPGLR